MNLTVKVNDPDSLGAVVMNGSVAVALCRPVQFWTKGDDGVLVPYQVTEQDALMYAKLFSAAPELLASLKIMTAAFEAALPDHCNADWYQEWNDAKAAIAKALGESK